VARAQIAEPIQPMIREAYRAWADQQPSGWFERIDDVVVAMSPDRVEHNDRKMLAWLTLWRAVQDAGLPCQVNGDGMTVELGDSDDRPDAILYCGTRVPPGTTTIRSPMLIAEVLSPRTSAIDRAWKLRAYFQLPSLRHYLIVWADRRQIVQHRRNDAGAIETGLQMSGKIRLDPPGIAISIEENFGQDG
jgi:Uma2 family endonuclease